MQLDATKTQNKNSGSRASRGATVTEAKNWLRDYLKGKGEVPSSEALAKGEELGYTRSTVQRLGEHFESRSSQLAEVRRGPSSLEMNEMNEMSGTGGTYLTHFTCFTFQRRVS
jgi:hypothetical protein